MPINTLRWPEVLTFSLNRKVYLIGKSYDYKFLLIFNCFTKCSAKFFRNKSIGQTLTVKSHILARIVIRTGCFFSLEFTALLAEFIFKKKKVLNQLYK